MFWPFKKNPPEIGLWDAFAGRGNSRDVLIEKAGKLAPVLVAWTRLTTGSLIDFCEKDSRQVNVRSKTPVVAFEVLLFYLHMTDRISQRHLDRDRAHFFMDTLLPQTRNLLAEDEKNATGLHSFAGELRDMYNDRQLEYSYYRFGPVGEGSLKGTLLWEFDKRISELLGFIADVPTIMAVQSFIVEGLNYIRLQELFAE